MNVNACNTFILNNSLAAVSALRKENRILATDGNGCNVHIFESDGRFCGCQATARPYRKLRYDTQSNSFTALGCCNRANLYLIDENLNECEYIELDSSENCSCGFNNGCTGGCESSCGNGCGNGYGCGCNGGFNSGFCDTNGCSELTDAMITRIGNECFFIGAFSKSAYLFDVNGRRLTRLCSTERGERITDFITFGEEKYAMSTIKNGIRCVSISENGVTQSAVLGCRFSLRMLFEQGGTIYGLFGQSYIYNRIIPIYSDGRLILP